MSLSSMPREQQKKLEQAASLLSAVQAEMAARVDRGSDEYIHTWQDIFWLRQKLDEIIRYGFVLYKGEYQQ
jgi:hypothetical protein